MEERVTDSAALERDAALFVLARRYFTTRGPATVNDFAWWSGLTKTDAKRGAEAAAMHLDHRSIEGKSYWFPAERPVRFSSPLANLLPNYDEYFIGFKNRSAFSARLTASGIEERTSALSGHILAINGQIVGGWRRTLVGRKVAVEPRLLLGLSETEQRAVGVATRKFVHFLTLPIENQVRPVEGSPQGAVRASYVHN
jgi:hypothetical protein